MSKAEKLMKSSPRKEEETTQATEESTKNKRVLAIIEKLKGKGAPSFDELEEWASTEPPAPTFPYRF